MKKNTKIVLTITVLLLCVVGIRSVTAWLPLPPPLPPPPDPDPDPEPPPTVYFRPLEYDDDNGGDNDGIIQLDWDPSIGASKYCVYRKSSYESWDWDPDVPTRNRIAVVSYTDYIDYILVGDEEQTYDYCIKARNYQEGKYYYSTPSNVRTVTVRDTDRDNDGMLNVEEEMGWWCIYLDQQVYSDPDVDDKDTDGLSDIIEKTMRTHPGLADTDGNGIRDEAQDTDGDGYLDYYESVCFKTDPFNRYDNGNFKNNLGHFEHQSVGQTTPFDCWLGSQGSVRGNWETNYKMDGNVLRLDGYTHIVYDGIVGIKGEYFYFDIYTPTDINEMDFRVNIEGDFSNHASYWLDIMDFVVENGEISINDEPVTEMSFESDRKYTFAIEMDKPSETFDIYIDDMMIPFRSNVDYLEDELNTHHYDEIDLYFWLQGETVLYLDNIKGGFHSNYIINGQNDGQEERISDLYYQESEGTDFQMQNPSVYGNDLAYYISNMNFEFQSGFDGAEAAGNIIIDSDGGWNRYALLDFFSSVDETEWQSSMCYGGTIIPMYIGSNEINWVNVGLTVIGPNGIPIDQNQVNSGTTGGVTDALFYTQSGSGDSNTRAAWQHGADMGLDALALILDDAWDLFDDTWTIWGIVTNFIHMLNALMETSIDYYEFGDQSCWYYSNPIQLLGNALIGSIYMLHEWSNLDVGDTISYVATYEVGWSKTTYRYNGIRYIVDTQISEIQNSMLISTLTVTHRGAP